MPRQPHPERDERVTLAPLDPEAALRALLGARTDAAEAERDSRRAPQEPTARRPRQG